MNKLADQPPPNRARRPLRVSMLGIRGFPDVQGGAEKHVEKLACALAALGCDVEAIVRASYVAKRRAVHHYRAHPTSPLASSYYPLPFGGYGCVWQRACDGYWYRTSPCSW